eukprot:235428_1
MANPVLPVHDELHSINIIFAPFMTHIAVKLINNNPEMTTQICPKQYCGSWGGGLNKLREYCPTWDELVHRASQTTPIQHPIWRTFLQQHSVSNISMNELNDLEILIYLLAEWQSAGSNKPGAYPSNSQQCTYLNLPDIAPITLSLRTCIVQNKFNLAFAEHGIKMSINNLQITTDKLTMNNKDYLIISPFLKHVLMHLLSKSAAKMQPKFTFNDLNGVLEFRNCYPEWDTMIDRACRITSIKHPIWRTFARNTDQSMKDMDIAQHLLRQWIHSDPSKQQMNAYMHMDGMRPIWQWLHDKDDAVKILNRRKPNKKAMRNDYGLILSPLLTHVVQRLLDIPCNHHYFDDEWTDVLKIMNECYRDWDDMVQRCVEVTPISHPIWKQILKESNVRNKSKIKSDRDVLKCLLSYWKHLKIKHESYSMYVPSKASNEYISITRINRIFGEAWKAFNTGAFDYYFITCTNHITCPIFDVFMNHVLSQLIQRRVDSMQKRILRQCFPEWSKTIQKCVKITPIDHPIWRVFIKTYSISNKKTLSHTDVIRYQLDYYSQNDTQPSVDEQQQYTKYITEEWIKIATAVIAGAFEEFMEYEAQRKAMTARVYDDNHNHEVATPEHSESDDEESEDVMDEVPAPYSVKHRTLSSLSHIFYPPLQEHHFTCKLCHKRCTESEGVKHKDFYCDECIQSNFSPKKKERSLSPFRSAKSNNWTSPRTEDKRKEHVPYHTKEHKLFDIEVTDDSPFNYKKQRKALVMPPSPEPQSEAKEEHNSTNIASFNDQPFDFDGSLHWNFDCIHPEQDMKRDSGTVDEDSPEIHYQLFEDGHTSDKTHYNMNSIKIFLCGIVALFVIGLINVFSDEIWIQLMFKWLKVIHYASVCSFAMWLYMILVSSMAQNGYEMVRRLCTRKAKVVDLVVDNDSISYRKQSKKKRNESDNNSRFGLICYMKNATTIWCNYSKQLWNPYVFSGVGWFCLYLLIAFDDMLPSKLNVLNHMAFATIVHGVWIVYFGYMLRSLSHGDDIGNTVGWYGRLNSAVYMIPFSYGLFMIGSMGATAFVGDFAFCKTLLCTLFEFALLTTISIII